MFPSSSPWAGPSDTPRPLKILLILLGSATLLSASLSKIDLASYLGLSRLGIEHFFYWQWITYLFVQPPMDGMGAALLIHLGFSLYLLWIFGTSIIERGGLGYFWGLFLGSAAASGFAAWGVMLLSRSFYLYIGPEAPLYGLLLAWILFNSEADILLFFTIALKARSALFILMGAALLIDLSNGRWPDAAGLAASLLFSYLFTLFVFSVRGPFPAFHPFERNVFRLKERIFSLFSKKRKNKPYHASNIYDIRSGQPVLDDEQFIDAMLARISLYGEDSLTPSERKRMTHISEKKALEKKF